MAFCTECGKTLTEGAAFCTGCGTPVAKIDIPEVPADIPAEPDVSAPVPAEDPVPAVPEEEPSAAPSAPTQEPAADAASDEAPAYPQPPIYVETPVYVSPSAGDVPPPKGKYSVVSTSSFFWLMLLYSIPVVGWIFCIIMAFAPKNKNLKHFARAHLIWILIAVIAALILAAVIYWLFSVMYSEIEHMLAVYGGDVEDIIEQYLYNNYGVLL